jgi:hypothetical protein
VFCLNGVKNITVARIILTAGLLWFKMERRMTLSGHVPSLSLIPLGTCHSGKYYIDGECLGKHSPYQFIYFSLLKEIINVEYNEHQIGNSSETNYLSQHQLCNQDMFV